jgi:hypothetical protein
MSTMTQIDRDELESAREQIEALTWQMEVLEKDLRWWQDYAGELSDKLAQEAVD